MPDNNHHPRPQQRRAEPGTRLLDTRGHACPIPVIRMEAALRTMAAGAQLTIIADDPVAVIDIPHFCAEAGQGVKRLPDRGRACVFLVTATGKTTA